VVHARTVVALHHQPRKRHPAHVVGGIHVPYPQPLGYLFERKLGLLAQKVDDLKAAVIGEAFYNPLHPPVVSACHTKKSITAFCKKLE